LNDRMMIALGLLVTVLVMISLVAYILSAGVIGYSEIASSGVVVLLVAFAFYVLWERAKSVSRGLPSKDERLEKINYRAGYYAFIAAIWSSVGAPLLSDILFGHELEGDLVTATIVIVSGLVFAATYLYLMWKGS
jgi:hypothetical protein